jgi:hypothetical protein
VTPKWRANVAGKEGVAAVGFYHRLRWAPWIMDKSGEPIELTAAEVTAEKYFLWGALSLSSAKMWSKAR